eukprot:TRINITY_DN35482_c0_g1_i1.p1 TRINITY_DN35482_c0_g1~~TRINITY_DN35482_c0_g1_i1.p1  ORF type:complete len:183 (+),score=29.47 TRINITY_DN35482_c0_g1_i1:227-775(+)
MAVRAEELLRVEDVIVLEKGYKLLEGTLTIVSHEIRGAHPHTAHFGVCGDVKVFLHKGTAVTREARGRYATEMMGRDLTFILPRDTEEDTIDTIETILTHLVRFTARDTASCVDGKCTLAGQQRVESASPSTPSTPSTQTPRIFSKITRVQTTLSASLAESLDNIGRRVGSKRDSSDKVIQE